MFNKNIPFDMESCNREPIMEPVINKCVEKEYIHEVKHCGPITTHIINKHILNHKYTPMYTCTSEDVIVNNDCGGCSKFIGR